MNSKLWTVFLMMLGVCLAGCVFRPPVWTSKEAVERIVNEKVPVGSARQVAEAFFRDAGVKWTEFPSPIAPKAPKSLVGVADIKSSWPVTTSVMVSFTLGADEKIESIKITESHTGP